MAETSLSIYGEGSSQDGDYFHISKQGLSNRVAEIAATKGETSQFTPDTENTTESLILAMMICQEASLSEENLNTDRFNIQVVFTSLGKSLDTDSDGNDILVFNYQGQFYQPVNLPGPNPDSI
jgi:hypothetical protein